MSLVSNQALREHFEQSSVTTNELARRLHYMRKRRHYIQGAPDAQAVRRALGFKSYLSNGERYPPQRKMRESTALRYCEALGLDPVDIGL